VNQVEWHPYHHDDQLSLGDLGGLLRWLVTLMVIQPVEISWKEVTTNIIFTHSLLSSLIQASNMVDIFIWPVDRNFPTAPPKQTIQNRVEL